MTEILGEYRMDAAVLNSAVLAGLGVAAFFYVLYGVVRAATRDGIIAARRRIRDERAEPGDADPSVDIKIQ